MRLLPLLALLVACPPADPTDEPPPADPWAEGCAVDAPEFRTIDVGEVSLHVACQGAGPTVLLMHGFPEFWRSWAGVMDELAGEYRLVAPDLRGYNTSDKPLEVEDYRLDALLPDVAGLIDALGGPVTLVGHDWGGGLAWAAAGEYPDRIDQLVIMNAPHMNVFGELLANDPEQQEAFSYLDLFVTPGFEDSMVVNDFGLLKASMGDALSDAELEHYKTAWGQPRAIEGGLNWYRANFTDGLPNTERELHVDVPTLVLWGMDDEALLPRNLDGLWAYVSDLTTQEVPGADHWITHRVPEVIAESIRGVAD